MAEVKEPTFLGCVGALTVTAAILYLVVLLVSALFSIPFTGPLARSDRVDAIEKRLDALEAGR